MTPSDEADDRLARSERLYEDVFDLSPEERAEALDRHRAIDPEAVADVEAMLQFTPDPAVGAGIGTVVGLFPESFLSWLPVPDALPGLSEIRRIDGAIGGRRIVCKARQGPPLNRPVAVKLIPIPPGTSPDRIAVLKEEANAQAQMLGMGHIIALAGVVEADGWFGLIMELAEGGSLRDPRWLARAHGNTRWAIATIRDIARGVDHARRKGFLHRDIKPENILFDGDGDAKVADFSLSRRIEPEGGPAIVAAEQGTKGYMAPEQRRGEQPTGAVDVYGLAVVLVEVAAGFMPIRVEHWTDDDRLGFRRALRARLGRSLGSGLATVLMKALSPDPNDRHKTAGDFADSLQAVIDGTPVRRPMMAMGLLVALALVSGGRYVSDARALAQVSARIEGLLDETARQIDAIAPADADDLTAWEGARKPLLQALVLLDHAPGRDDLAARASALGGKIDAGRGAVESRIADAKRDELFVQRLRSARMAPTSAMTKKGFNYAAGDRAYEAAFRAYLGQDLLRSTDPDALIATITRSPLRKHLAAALVEWMLVRMKDALTANFGKIMLVTRECQILRKAALSLGGESDDWDRRFYRAFGSPFAAFALRRLAKDTDFKKTTPGQLTLLGEVLIDQDVDIAIAFLNEANEAHPHDYWINYYLIVAMWTKMKEQRVLANGKADVKREVELALRAAKAGGAVDPEPNMMVLIGIIFADAGMKPEAVKQWREVVKLWPDDTRARANIVRALLSMENQQEARAILDDAPERVRAEPLYRLCEADCLLGAGRTEEAVAVYRAVLVPGNEFDRAEYLKYAEALRRLPNIAEAISTAKIAQLEYPRDVDEFVKACQEMKAEPRPPTDPGGR